MLTWTSAARPNGEDDEPSFAIPQGADCPYWSQGDESAFFRGLESIPGREGVKGQGLELIVTLRSRPNFFPWHCEN